MSNLGDMMGMFSAIAAGESKERIGTRPDDSSGNSISTVNTVDCGWESALCGASWGTLIIERYDGKTQADSGHDKWCKWLDDNAGKEVEVLDVGYGTSIDPETHTVQL